MRAVLHYGCHELLLAVCACMTGCGQPAGAPPSGSTAHGTAPADWTTLRARMVDEQIIERGIRNEQVLAAMRYVPRHEFVPDSLRERSYDDRPLPIGEGQTISQPYIVALMTELAEPEQNHRVLEVGTGSGYQAAVLAELVADVYSIELLPTLAESATERLQKLGYADRVHVRAGDGYLGWPEAAPFDSILVTCGADHVPEPLFEQLKPGGKLIIPVGSLLEQKLRVVEKNARGERRTRDVLPVRFVPLRRQDPLKQE